MSPSPRWRFGPFEADLREQQLRHGATPVPVTRKAFALLGTLLERPGALFTKAELFDTVWPGRVVTDAALSRVIRELRVALADDAGEPRYIATVHGTGFRFIAPVQRVLPDAAPAPAAAPPAAPASQVVGRAAESALLDQLLHAAQSGQRQIAFISGVAGIGKTSLVEDFALRHAGGRVHIAQGRCIEQYGTGEAYLPLLEAMESLARQAGAAELAALLLRHAPTWLAQLPWLAHEVDAAALQRATAGATAQRMLRELAQALEMLAAQHTVVLWLEDLHWSDPSTLEAIAFLAGRREPARLLLLASCRPAPRGGARPLDVLVQRLAQRGQARELPLGLLDEPAVAAYLQRRAPPAPGTDLQALARFVHRRTEGHALFTVAVVDDLERRRELQPGPAGWVLAGPVESLGTGLPDSLRQLVRQQIEQLPADERRAIEAAAVAGPEFAAASVAAALQAAPADVEERLIGLAGVGGLLRARPAVQWPDGTESSGFAFVHALYWQGCHEGVAPGRRAEWQRRIAEREEQAWGAHSDAIAAELAMRFEAARELPRAVHYLRRAGAMALSRHAYREGVELLMHAARLVERLPEPGRARQELDLLLPLGAAQMALQGYAATEVEATYRRALELCRGCARPGETERTLRGLWNVALVRARLDEAQLAADELVLQAAAAGDRSASFDAFAKLGQTAMHRGDLRSARAHLEHALALPLPAEDGTRQREAPRVLAYLAWVLWYAGEPGLARQRAEQALASARAAGSAHSTAFALGFVGWLHDFLGEAQHMRALAAQQAALSAEHDLLYWRVWSDMLLALAEARLAGSTHSAAACARMQAALQAFAAQGAEVGVSHFFSALAEAEMSAGRMERARAALAESAALLARNGNAYHAAETRRLQGELARTGGDLHAARRHFEAAAEQARAQGALALAERARRSLAGL